VRRPQRGEVRQQIFALDDLLPSEHPVRDVWDFAEALDLPGLLAPSNAKAAGTAPIEPALLVALWLWATTEGVGSARQIERLCTRSLSYRWLCGGVGIDYQILRGFRSAHGETLDRLLAWCLASLVEEGVIDLELVSPPTLKEEGLTGTSLERRRKRLKALIVAAAARVDELRAALDRDDPIADERHDRAARSHAAQRRGMHVKAALSQTTELFSNQSKKHRRRQTN
jgi:transposase